MGETSQVLEASIRDLGAFEIEQVQVGETAPVFEAGVRDLHAVGSKYSADIKTAGLRWGRDGTRTSRPLRALVKHAKLNSVDGPGADSQIRFPASGGYDRRELRIHEKAAGVVTRCR